jgi:outer membrane protein insertion porin family
VVRVLVFIIVFSIFSINLFGFEIEGEIDEHIKEKVLDYVTKGQHENIRTLLNNLGIISFELSKNKLIIYPTLKMDNIVLHGNLNFLSSTILSEIGFYKGSPVYLESFDYYKEKIISFYKSRGFYDVNVYYKIGKNRVDYYIKEGKLYLLNETHIYFGDEPIVEEKYANPKILTEDLVNNTVEKALKEIKMKGYLFSDFDVYYEKSYSRFFFNLDSPVHSILSILPLYHKGVKLVVKIYKSEKYEFLIEGVDEKKSKEARLIIAQNLKGLDSYYIGITRTRLQEKFGVKNTFFDIYENKILLKVEEREKKLETVYKVNIKPPTNVDALLKTLKASKPVKNSEIETVVGEYLNSLGYFEYSLNIKRENNTIVIQIKLGNKALINNIFVQDKLILKDVNLQYSKSVGEALIEEVRVRLSDEYYFTYLLIDYFDYNKDANKVDVYFKSDIKELYLRDVISLDNNISEKISKKIRRNSKITVSKLNDVAYYIKNTFNINTYTLVVIEDENYGDIIFNYEKPDKNYVYAELQYDNVDKLKVLLGYKRFNFLNSDFLLDTGVTLSEDEKGYNLQFSRFDRTKGFQTKHTYGFGYIKRKEDDFKYKKQEVAYSIDVYKNKFRGEIDLAYEHLDVYSSDFVNRDYEEKYDIFKFPIKIAFLNVTGDLSGLKLNFDAKLEPFFSEEFKTLNSEMSMYSSLNLFHNFFGSLRLSGGKFINDVNRLPVVYRYTLGGPYRMKAFSDRELGPKDSEGRVYGGDGYIYSEVAIPYKIIDNLYFGPFFEVGKVYNKGDSSKLYKDIGVKLDIDVVIGEIVLSYAKSFSSWGKKSDAFYISFRAKF